MARVRRVESEPSPTGWELIDVRRAYRTLRLLAGDDYDRSRWPTDHDVQAMTVEDALDVAQRFAEAMGLRFPPDPWNRWAQ